MLINFFQSMSEEKYRPLASRLLVGRPRWKLLLDEIGRTNKQWVEWSINSVLSKELIAYIPQCYFLCVCGFSKRVGVFCCGPKGISRTLHRLCNSARSSGTTFEFNKESFSWLCIRAGPMHSEVKFSFKKSNFTMDLVTHFGTNYVYLNYILSEYLWPILVTWNIVHVHEIIHLLYETG